MAVYTAFGGMEQLQVALREKAFRGLGDRLRALTTSGDPVADVAAMGLTYCSYALEEPNLYRATFLEERISGDDIAAGLDALTPLLEAVSRCIEAGRFSGEPPRLAAQLWATTHGAVSAHLAGLFGFALANPELTDSQLLAQVADMGTVLFVGFGDDPERAKVATQRARKRLRRRPNSGDRIQSQLR
jgi:AcrR family transcriptional regulator